jgi:hypothetical protein
MAANCEPKVNKEGESGDAFGAYLEELSSRGKS